MLFLLGLYKLPQWMEWTGLLPQTTHAFGYIIKSSSPSSFSIASYSCDNSVPPTPSPPTTPPTPSPPTPSPPSLPPTNTPTLTPTNPPTSAPTLPPSDDEENSGPAGTSFFD